MKGNWLASLLMLFTLSVAAAQQTNQPAILLNGQTFDATLAKATNGDSWSEYCIAVSYLPGASGNVNFVEALKWLTKSALHGNSEAQSELGNFYQYAWGGVVDEDNNKAAYWYLRSAKQGNDESQIEIGWMYYNGQGVMQDYIEAYKWFNIACTSSNKPLTKEQIKQLGNDDSMKDLLISTADKAKAARDHLAQFMTPEQIAVGQQRSVEFVPRIEAPISDSNNSASPENPTASGSGFFITDDGYLISNYHVVKDAKSVRLLT